MFWGQEEKSRWLIFKQIKKTKRSKFFFEFQSFSLILIGLNWWIAHLNLAFNIIFCHDCENISPFHTMPKILGTDTGWPTKLTTQGPNLWQSVKEGYKYLFKIIFALFSAFQNRHNMKNCQNQVFCLFKSSCVENQYSWTKNYILMVQC